MNPISTVINLIERELNNNPQLVPIYNAAQNLVTKMLSGEISYSEYRMEMLKLAYEHRHIFLYYVSQTALPDMVAQKMGIPLEFWLELVSGDAEMDVAFKYALDAGELQFQRKVLQEMQNLRIPSSVVRSLSEYLRLRRPERYNVKVTRSVSREEVLREVLSGIEIALLQALNEAGVQPDAQAKIIDLFRSRLRKVNQ